uniref:Glutamate receptor n=1 Tax=Zea mays TaxID=4577 RepID=A0A804PCL2_MAIZE
MGAAQLVILFLALATAVGAPPSEVAVGALFTYDSTIGRAAKLAIELAVDDVNSDGKVLPRTQLNLVPQDTNCSGFLGTIEDPTLSASEYPYFIRTTISDYFQMNAIASIVDYYQWKRVTAIFVDDDYGRGGVEALGDALALKRAKISYKAAIPPNSNTDVINDVLFKANMMESRVMIVHVNPDTGMRIFSVAKNLQMMASGYVWIVTDWLAAVLDSSANRGLKDMSHIQGLIVLRQHIPESEAKDKFISKWNNVAHNRNITSGLNSYGFYAYDSVWAVARAVDKFLSNGQQINFSTDPRLEDSNGSTLHLSSLKIFDGGEQMLHQLLLTNFTGVTGPVQFDSEHNLMPRNTSTSAQQLHDVVWPGDSTTKPKGWVFPNTGLPLRVGVPIKASFKELVSGRGDNMSGYCIEIFNAAIKLLPYPVPCQFITIGDGTKNPSYIDIIRMVAANSLDAAVGDFAIVRNGTQLAEYTQPYIESGLVIVAPVKHVTSSAWAFLEPFTLEMWCVTVALFILVGIVVWLLEHRTNEEFRGSPRRQVITMLWFSFSTMFFSHRENTVSTLGRFVLIIWLFVVLIITSSYTASLTSILTVQQLSTGITGIDSLVSSSLPIGYQAGKFTKRYLTENFNVPLSRLVPLNSIQEYADALNRGPKNGGVAAIVDEKPYIDIFLSNYCSFRIVGEEFTKEGWGFAFQRDSPLAADLSTAILQLSESGQLQRIHDEWFSRSSCSSDDSEVGATRLGLGSFWGLFLVCALICLFALLVFFIRVCRQYNQYSSSEAAGEPSTAAADPVLRQRRPSRLGSFKDLIQFVDKKEEEIKKTMKRRSGEKDSQAAGFSYAQSVASA